MRLTTLSLAADTSTYVGLVYAVVEGTEEEALKEAIEELEKRAESLGANAVIGIQVAQSNFQWNPRTVLLGPAVKLAESEH
jgi:uncharacterized protein YbjQ (UPF0145 family)